jgi:L-ribulokinase
MFGAVAAGIHRTVAEAQKRMGSGFDRVFKPDARRAALYRKSYSRYLELGAALEPLLKKL